MMPEGFYHFGFYNDAKEKLLAGNATLPTSLKEMGEVIKWVHEHRETLIGVRAIVLQHINDSGEELSKEVVMFDKLKKEISEAVLEELAALEHEQWAHWTDYMLKNMNTENISRWKQQIETPYENLTEKEKQSDRIWALKVIEFFDKGK